MPIDQELVDMMIHALVIEPVVVDVGGVPVKDAFSKMTWGSAVSVRCQIVRMNKVTRGRNGTEVMSTLQAILADPELVVNENDRITIADGSHPAIIAVLAASDEEGPYYLEVRA